MPGAVAGRLPGKDGLTLTRELRVRSEVGIILITGRNDEIDRIVGLECGADDYVSKPLNPPELVSRPKNLLRRVRHAQQQNPPPAKHRRREALGPLHGAAPAAGEKLLDLLRLLETSLRQLGAPLRAALEQADCAQAAALAHCLAGSADSLGFQQLTRQLRAVAEAAEQDDDGALAGQAVA